MQTREFLDIVGEAMGLEAGSLSLEDTPDTVEEWDSLGQLVIISILESELHVDTDSEEFKSFASMKELVETLKAKGLLRDDA
jgi:acyl carrier protein